MSRILETCFYLRDDQIAKHGRTCANAAFTTGTFFIVMAALIVVQFGLRPSPMQTKFAQISTKLIQHANATASGTRAVVQTDETCFLQKLQSFITKIPFIAGVLLLSLGTLLIQCGLMYRKLILQTGKSPFMP